MISGAPIVIAIDQGTTSSRVVAFDPAGKELAVHGSPLPISYPHDGWVEQNPLEIWNSVREPLEKTVKSLKSAEIGAIGITNQRETVVAWNRRTGEPLGPAIVWQCRRTADFCLKLKEQGLAAEIRSLTGLVIDPYFSASKIVWLLQNAPQVRRAADKGEAVFGTVDSWVLYNLTGGREAGVIATEPSNASRTMLADLKTGQWSSRLLDLFSIKREWLPEIRPSIGNFGTAKIAGLSTPVLAMLGDQQASLFGNGAFIPGQAKCTFGTGAFLLANTGGQPAVADDGLLTTIGWKYPGALCYAREGSVFVAGSAVQWLRDGLGLLKTSAQSEQVAGSVSGSGGVYIVPAFTGLGAPHWDSRARGLICGITRDTSAAQIVRAALEGVAHQVADLIETGGFGQISRLAIDGGMSSNRLFAGILADLTGIEISISPYVEMTAFGAARAALTALVGDSGSGAVPQGFSAGTDGETSRLVQPVLSEDLRRGQRDGWRAAVVRTLGGGRAS